MLFRSDWSADVCSSDLAGVANRAYLDHTMTDYIPTDEELETSFAKLPKIPGIQE